MSSALAPDLKDLDRRSRRLGYWFLAYLLMYPLPWLIKAPSAAGLAASAAGIAAFLALYLRAYGRTDSGALAYAAAIALIGFALRPFGGIWGVFVVYACALLAYVQPRRTAFLALAVLGVAVLAFALLLDMRLWEYGPTLFFGLMVAVGSFYAAALERTSAELAASRDEARRLAVVAERERIARDLHDLLGHTLTVVAVKADLAGRLVDRDPARAKSEIEDIRSTARAALADVRAAVTGMRSTSLATEVATARRALASAGVAFEYRGPAELVPPEIETVLALVIREGVTNVVRHSQAQHCAVAFERIADRLVLTVRDSRRPLAGSAVPDAAEPSGHREGNGLAGMRQRLAAVGGTLEFARAADGTTLRARVPLGSPPAAGAALATATRPTESTA
jgi:two-component system sensor histidine kinase DesK